MRRRAQGGGESGARMKAARQRAAGSAAADTEVRAHCSCQLGLQLRDARGEADAATRAAPARATQEAADRESQRSAHSPLGAP